MLEKDANPNDAQGIIFAVSPNEDTAYLVAFTDLMKRTNLVYFILNANGDTVGVFRGYRFNATTNVWSKSLFEVGATDKDGEVNTEKIIKAAKEVNDTSTAAQACREYYKKAYGDTVSRTDYDRDTKWETTKGFWYLPSMQELAALMKVRDRINQKYLQGTPASDAPNKIYFQAIGDKSNLDSEGKNTPAYWSSTEYDKEKAWYDLPASNNDNYVPKTWGNEGGLGCIYVRPIRKVAL